MPTPTPKTDLPPRWLIRTIWRGHRLLVRVTGGRLGLYPPVAGKRMGMMRVHAIGRTSGRPRPVVLGYFEDGENLATLAMNGWAPTDPAWWRNLKAHPDVRVDLGLRRRRVHARAAEADERARLWVGFTDHPGWGDVDAFAAAKRPLGTTVVVLEPR
ncbi:nitroreductase/quinone reductase family protein [Pseudolysinimonas sp.]|uniref:nitroreductase/quinone reductase family protein n=1 Tax=Pseudolysinimonas sp. TaxID=2680009 RepID=UPI00286CD22B|nr:nitroreductase/quinone reductase family protein [Pseudolysinimonas sp.]